MFRILLLLFLIGCTTVNSARKEFERVNYSDGISKKEAVVIAKMAMINSKLNKDYHLWTAGIHDNSAGYWRVVFSSLYFNRHSCVVIIEKERGEILAFYEAVNVEEQALGVEPAYSIEGWRRLNKFD